MVGSQLMVIRLLICLSVIVISSSCITGSTVPGNKPDVVASQSPMNVMGSTSIPAPELGVVVDEKFTVVDIEPGSAAEVAGVQRGDNLLSIGEKPFTSERMELKFYIASYPSADASVASLSLKLIRHGAELELPIRPSPPGPHKLDENGKPPPTATGVFSPNDYF